MSSKTQEAGANAVGHKNLFTAIATAIYDLFSTKGRIPALPDNTCINGKTCLVTGANTGLGFAIATQLAQKGAHVMMACRSGIPEAGEKVKQASGSNNVEMLHVDLSDLKSVEALCDEMKERGTTIDIFVANAGLMPKKARKTNQGFEVMFAVHFLANRYMCERFLQDDIIKPATTEGEVPRIIFVSSEAHQSSEPIDFDRFGAFEEYGVWDGLKHYGKSKLHLCTLANELSRRTNSGEDVQVAVHSLCPGPVASNIARESPALLKPLIVPMMKLLFRSPEKAAEPVIYLACAPEMEKQTGVYLHMMREKSASPLARDEVNGKKLWEKSAEIIRDYEQGRI